MKQFVEIVDLSDTEYHAIVDGEGRAYSSSQLKDALDDIDVFYRSYITKEIPKEQKDAFDIGQRVHTAILEPHKLDNFVCFEGVRKEGSEKWEKFKAENQGKIFLTKGGIAESDVCIEGLKRSPLTMEKYTGGDAEVSICVPIDVDVDAKKIYVTLPDNMGILCLGQDGWEPLLDGFVLDLSSCVRMNIKCRCDYRKKGLEISDIKTTTGNVLNERNIRAKVRDLKYDLSAALYLDMFNVVALVNGEGLYQDFYWSFCNKKLPQARTWKANPVQIKVGRAKWVAAVLEVAAMERNNWDIQDQLTECGHDSWEANEWLSGERSTATVLKVKTTEELMSDVL